jgi:hypothetical protein
MDLEDPTVVPSDPIDHVAPLRWTCVALLVATVLLGLSNPTVVGAWYDGLTPGPTTIAMRPAVERWNQTTDPLAGPARSLRAAWQHVRGMRFGRETPGEPGAEAAN